MSNKKKQLLTYASSGGRVCPNPDEWMALSDIIGMNAPGKRLVPLILAGWAFSSDADKRDRVMEQIEYAFSLDPLVTERFCQYLESLKPGRWYVGNEPPDKSRWDGT
jgi:hypothetical protein